MRSNAAKLAPVDNDFAEQPADDADTAGLLGAMADLDAEIAAETVSSEIATIQEARQPAAPEPAPADNKTLIRRSKASLVVQLAGISSREDELQVKMAAAKTAHDSAIARAEAEFAEIKTDVDADLYQTSTLKRVLDQAVGELNKAEL